MYTLNLRNEMRDERDNNHAISTQTYSHPPAVSPLIRRRVNRAGSVDSAGLDVVSGISPANGPTTREWKRRSSSVRRLDVHVETVLTRTTRKVGDIEVSQTLSVRHSVAQSVLTFFFQLQDFQNGMDPIKSPVLKDGNDEDDDHDSWEVKK